MIKSAANEGTSACTVVSGPPGIGKTRLVAEALESVQEYRLNVVSGRASKADRISPLGVLRSTLGRCPELRTGLERLGPYQGDASRYIEQLGELLAEYAVSRRLLIVIDDIQWADEISLMALRILVAELSSSPVTWLLVRRTLPVAASGDDLVVRLGQDVREIILGPLDARAARRLCTILLGAKPDANLLALLTRGGGHPLLMQQLVSGLRSADRLVVKAGVVSMDGADLPRDFLDGVMFGLHELRQCTLSLLEAGSIFGRAFTVHAAAQLIQAPPQGELLAATREAVAAGVLETEDSHLVFRHDLVRDAVYQNIPGPSRAALHRAAVAVVLDEGRPTAEAAEHLMRSGPRGDHEAVALLRKAADDIWRLDPGLAADHLVHALEITPRQDPGWPDQCAQAVTLLALAGRLEEAQKYGEAALGGGLDPVTRGKLLFGLAQCLKHAGQNRGVLEYAHRALEIEELADETKALLYALVAHARNYVDDGRAADEAGAEAYRLGLASGEYSAAVSGLTARSVAARHKGRLDDALGYARQAAELADQKGGETLHRHPSIWFGAALAAKDRFEEAEQVYARAHRDAERLGTAWSQPLSHFHHASLHAFRARLDDAIAEAEAGLNVADRLGVSQLAIPLHGLLATIAVLRNEMPVAHEHLRKLRKLLDAGITAAPELVAWPRAALLAARHDAPAALSELAKLYDQLPSRLLLFVHDPGCAPAMVRIAMEADDPDRARAAATAIRRLANRNRGVVSLAGAAFHAEGLLDDNTKALTTAVARLRKCARPLMLASALEDVAKAEYRVGSRPRAVECVEEALELYAGCGAQLGIERLRRRQTTMGVTRTTSETAPTRMLRLTPTERKVARLVAQGMTNHAIASKLGISYYTVDAHLRHIYSRLGIKSRAQLAAKISREEDGA
jgi:DNA-binding CsgD family transcriptional regulator